MRIQIFENGQSKGDFVSGGALFIGRQDVVLGEPGPYQYLAGKDLNPGRLIVAPTEQKNVSRREIKVSKTDQNQIRFENLTTTKVVLDCGSQTDLLPKQVLDLDPPVVVRFPLYPQCEIQISHQTEWKQNLNDTFFRETILDPTKSSNTHRQPQYLQNLDWMEGMKTAIRVLNQTLTSNDFFPSVAKAIKEFVSLDGGRVLIFQDGIWKEECQHPPGQMNRPWSQTALEQVRQSKEPWFKDQDSGLYQSHVTKQLSILIATPFFGEQGEVIGALYGEKESSDGRVDPKLFQSYIQWMNLLAAAVTTGIRLFGEQKKKVEAETRFAAFTSPKLAQRLSEDPTLLKGRKEEVSVLFADIRGFSRISERIGPEKAIDWITSIMNDLSKEIDSEDGITTGYLGDGLMALWGAPTKQDDHASRAIQAGLRILDRMPEISRKWQDIIKEECKIGLGINTGDAMVGNVGSELKVQYGALGNTVNLASRVEGLTKYLKCPLLVTGFTRKKVQGEFLFRRVCRTQVANIAEPVEIFEAARTGGLKTQERFAISEEALDLLEHSDFTMAARKAGEGLSHFPGDGPLLLTLNRATRCLVEELVTFDPVWEPPGK